MDTLYLLVLFKNHKVGIVNSGIFVPYDLQINSEWIPANFAYIQIHFIFSLT